MCILDWMCKNNRVVLAILELFQQNTVGYLAWGRARKIFIIFLVCFLVASSFFFLPPTLLFLFFPFIYLFISCLKYFLSLCLSFSIFNILKPEEPDVTKSTLATISCTVYLAVHRRHPIRMWKKNYNNKIIPEELQKNSVRAGRNNISHKNIEECK